MRLSSLTLARMGLLLACLILATSAAMARTDVPPSRVQVTWAPAEQLSEVKDNQIRRGWMRVKDWQTGLSDYFATRADRYLAPGQQLQILVDDIHLAGAFEPWHGPSLDDVRYYKDIYPPHMNLHYRLLAADGTVVREADARLSDLGYLQRSVAFQTDPLRYDKRMIDDWLRTEFGPPR